MISFLTNLRTVAPALACAALMLTVLALGAKNRDMAQRLSETRQALSLANNTILYEQAQNNALVEQIAEQRRLHQADLDARDAARKQLEQDLELAKTKTETIYETITIETQADPELERCLAYELPDSIMRELPN